MSSDSENTTPQGPPPPDFVNKPTPPPNIPAPNIPAPSLTPPPNVAPVSAAPASDRPPIYDSPVAKPAKEEAVDETLPVAGALASVNNRIVAILIDSAVAIGLHIAFLIILPGAIEFLGSLAVIAYWLTRDSLPFLEGQSIGKKVVKIKAVTQDGQTLVGNWPPGLIRNAVLFIPFFAIIELIVLLTRDGKPEQGYRLGDEWAKTKVINVPTVLPNA